MSRCVAGGPSGAERPGGAEEGGGELSSDEVLREMASTFKAMSDPTRLKIINLLLLSEMRVGMISASLGLSQPVVSHHLSALRRMRLVKRRREGQASAYSLNDYHIQLLFDLCRTHVLEPAGSGPRRG